MKTDDIRIVFFDIDGTLRAFDSTQLSPRTHDTLLQLQKNNIRICIATGRPPLTTPKFDGIDFDAIINFNGSYCIAGKDEIYKNPIETKAVHQIISNASKIGRPVVLSSIDRMLANGRDEDLVEYFKIANVEVPSGEGFEELANQEIYQIMSGGRKSEYDALLHGVTGAEITTWRPRAVDIIPKNGSKAFGIQKVLKYFHLDKSQSLAFGDGGNDIAMLQSVGLGVAMGNASDDVKHAAGAVCGSAENDGIYIFCKEHHLIGE